MIKRNLTEQFLEGLKEVEKHLLVLGFKPFSFNKMGYAYFVKYQKGKTTVKFLFGPSDWDVEMIIYTSKGEFAFKELLGIPVIAKWVNDNMSKPENERNVKNELQWFVGLLKFSLPIVE